MDATSVSVATSQRFLNVTQYAYPMVLLVTFLVAFTARSIVVARKVDKRSEEPEESRVGPGGKNLPSRQSKSVNKDEGGDADFTRPAKLLFNWLSVIVCATFVASAADIIVHALVKREDGWWCGQAPVVSEYHTVTGQKSESLLGRVPLGFRSDFCPSTIRLTLTKD